MMNTLSVTGEKSEKQSSQLSSYCSLTHSQIPDVFRTWLRSEQQKDAEYMKLQNGLKFQSARITESSGLYLLVSGDGNMQILIFYNSSNLFMFTAWQLEELLNNLGKSYSYSVGRNTIKNTNEG